MYQAFITSIPVIPSHVQSQIPQRKSTLDQNVHPRMSTRPTTKPTTSSSSQSLKIAHYVNTEKVNTLPTNFSRPPAQWLKTNQSSFRIKSFSSTSTSRNHLTRSSLTTNPSTSPRILNTTGTKFLATGMYFSTTSKWLYTSPPSYCNVTIDSLEMQRMLEKRVFYLGPVMSNKVVRAIELARAAVALNSQIEPIFVHNITVALIVTDLQMDCETICAAVLHNLVDRPGCTRELIEKDVGKDVFRILEFHAQIVDRVSLCVDNSFTELSFSNLRELILVGAEEEDRSISLELARAVLAIRTVDKLSDEQSRIQVARRAMYLYAPLANQLGIWFVQGELEELAFMYLHPESYHMIRHLVGERRKECESTLVESKVFLERILNNTPEVRSLVRTINIRGRVKGLYSVYRKMRRSGKKVYEIYDLLALRVIVEPKKADEAFENAACYAVANVIERYYETLQSRGKDYIAKPKRNGYKSLHMTVLPKEGSTPLEIQIRTERMHHVAEFGAAAHWIYKEKSALEEAVKNSTPPSSPPSGGKINGSIDHDISKSEVDVDNSSHAEMFSSIQLSPFTHPDSTFSHYPRPKIPVVSRKASSVSSVGLVPVTGQDAAHYQMRKGYVTGMASAIRTSRVIVAAAGQLYGLAVGSTLLDLAHGLGMASLGMIAVVNGSVAPLTQRLEMNDIVRFTSALPAEV